MPFTIAHAAAAPPLWRLTGRRLVLSAVAIGTVSPDLEYLLHLRPHRTIGHTVAGVFLMCVPLTLAALWLWHRLIGPHLSRLLPERWAPVAAAASQPFSFGPPGRFLVLCISAAAGAATHLLWDSFTHSGGYPVTHFSLLRESLWDGGPGLYKLLQYGSSVVGLGLVGSWLLDLAERPAPAPVRPALPPRARRMWVGMLLAGIVLVAAGNALGTYVTPWTSMRDVFVAALVGGMTGTVLSAVGISTALALGRTLRE